MKENLKQFKRSVVCFPRRSSFSPWPLKVSRKLPLRCSGLLLIVGVSGTMCSSASGTSLVLKLVLRQFSSITRKGKLCVLFDIWGLKGYDKTIT